MDEDLNVSVGGNYKLSWSGDLLWTSGLLPTSPTKFPTTIPDWTLRSVYADSKQALFVNVHGPALFAVDAANGEMIGKALALPVPIVTATTSVQQNIYILGGGKVYRTTPELPPLEEYFILPTDLVAKNPNGIAVSADQKTIYLSVGSGETARVYAYTDGALQWEAKAGQVLVRHKNILLTANPTGPGVLALDTADGTFSAIFGQAAVGARPPLTSITGAAIGSKNGMDYLFIASQYRVLVYRIVVAGEGE